MKLVGKASDAPAEPCARLAFTSEKDPLSYHPGEEMRFAISATGGHLIRWRRTGDDGRTSSGEAASGGGREGDNVVATVATSLDRPGFVRLTAELLDEAGNAIDTFDGGAGAAVESIRPDKPEPPDFDAFWARRKAALAAVPMEGAQCREIASPLAGVRLFEVSVPCAGGRPSTGFLSLPDRPGPFPARIHFHGYNESWEPSA
ncbi:MAG: acetylxylan esterase, partial [Kiritimatiellae bacterium]|nr:acetylxylan esterase [Kiritimatiellia bacterium]